MFRILIIEDDPDLADFMAITLRTAGHIVDVAADGAAAMRALRGALPDLLIVDIMLPDGVGLSLCENLRRSAAAGATPLSIIVTSACDEADARPLATAVGANDFLPKPFSPYQLLLRVHALLGCGPRRRLAS